MHPLRALELARRLGGIPDVLRVVACEPASLGDDEDDPMMGLSPEVEAAVDEAVAIVERLAVELASKSTEATHA